MSNDGGVWTKVWPECPPEANFTDVPTGTYTDGDGVNYKYLTFTGTGTVTFDRAGVANLVIVGGGGGSGASFGCAGGGGGVIVQHILAGVGTSTVTVGAGGAGGGTAIPGSQGDYSQISSLAAIGGGGGEGGGSLANAYGGSPGGSYANSGGYITGQGNNCDGTVAKINVNTAPSGGAGGQGSASTRVGGVGLSSDITGSAISYSPGGSGYLNGSISSRPAAPGKGGDSESRAGTAGVVIIRVVV